MEAGNWVIGLILPFVISLVKQEGWPDSVNRLIALAVYVAWAFVSTAATLGFSQGIFPFLVAFAQTIVVGTVTYQLILKGFGIDDALTRSTSVVKSPDEDVVVEG